MASHQDDNSVEDTASSLGDSNYDFIDDRSVATTDDEEQDQMTASTTSSDAVEIEAPGPQGDLVGTNGLSTSHQDGSPETLRTPTFGSERQEQEDPAMATQFQDVLAQLSSEPIVFEEPSVIDLKSSSYPEVSQNLATWNASDVAQYMGPPSPSSASKVHLHVRQRMALQNFDLKNQVYKVLYKGNTEMKESIMQKIGAALAACPRPSGESRDAKPSKFNVIPVSGFGDTMNPEVVLIDSSGLELIVEDCISASARSPELRHSPVELKFSNGRSVKSVKKDSSFEFSENWDLPDLAICCVSRPEVHESDTLFQIFMSRHSINTVVISDEVQLDQSPIVDLVAPHLCLEYENPTSHTTVKRGLPIDLATFLRIDAGQMNRSLACLADRRKSSLRKEDETERDKQGPAAVKADKDVIPPNLLDVLKGTMANPPLLVFCLVSIIYGLFMLNTMSGHLGSAKVGSASKDAVSSPHAPAVVVSLASQLSFSSSIPTAGSTSPIRTPSVNTLSAKTDMASFLLDAYPSASGKSEKFQIHVLGDCHVVLRPPHWLTKIRKPPPMLFDISRRGVVLTHKVSSLFDGVYALQIAREEAYGSLNVSVRTETKPFVNETFEVDFGSSWLKVAAWKRATRALTAAMQQDLDIVQSSLSVVYNHTRSELSTFVQNTKEHVASRRGHQYAQSKWAVRTKSLIIAQSKDLSRILSIKLHHGRKEASKQMHALARDLRSVSRDLYGISSDIHTTSTEIAQTLATPFRSRSLASYRRAGIFAGFGTKAVSQRLDEALKATKRHYRDSQKRALKAWWRIKGTPGRKSERWRASESRE